MNQVFWEMASIYEVDVDHEWYHILKGELSYSPTLFYIDDREWESHSGFHSVDTTVPPVLLDKYGSYYIARPVAEIDLMYGRFRVRIFKEIPGFTDLLRKFHGLDGRRTGYVVPDYLTGLARQVGLRWFNWWAGYHEKSKSIDVLFVEAPHSEREAAEWFADWYWEHLPEFMERKLFG